MVIDTFKCPHLITIQTITWYPDFFELSKQLLAYGKLIIFKSTAALANDRRCHSWRHLSQQQFSLAVISTTSEVGFTRHFAVICSKFSISDYC